ncbi:phosphatase PAP2 family protein [Muricoccus pecuniae]|uniref:Inositolphosphotransferase Aur1/Ipt1 domain-containing protein n=1 Tax=Muricoccus pecuniae TaxID=693023 RepID=A0A840Y0I7_9PROT|nr:phosphatase PAP2 family protein [Roseomonas pecuniae]MBB5693100.1 hypothetical protein [Roseomonas pecuniae]
MVGVAFVLVLIQEAVSLRLGTIAPHDYFSPTVQAPTALGAFVLTFILVSPSARVRILILGLGIEGARILLQVATGRPLLNLVLFPGFGLGVASWGYLAWEVLATRGAERQRNIDLLAAALAFPLGNLLMWPSVFGSIPFLPVLFDGVLLRLDATLGFQPAAAVGALFREVPPLFALHLFVYVQLPLAMCVIAGLEARSGRRLGIGLIPVSLAAAGIGYAFYLAVPAVGPRPVFGDGFAEAMRGLAVMPAEPVVNTTHPRNVMPSMHVTWALLILLAARLHGRRVLIGAALFALGTALATLGLGEHYFVDLVVALPLVLLMRGLGANGLAMARGERWGAVALGVALLAGWALIGRGVIDPTTRAGLAPMLMAATAFACIAAERTLFRAERGLRAAPALPIRVPVGRLG